MTDALMRALDAKAEAGQPVRFWLRDDDAVAPTAALDRLLETTAQWHVPLTLAVIPRPAGPPLAERLRSAQHVTVAVHGWTHANHAPPAEKKQELGPHRPLQTVTDELRLGIERLRDLVAAQVVPVLVPPWNRIAPAVAAALPDLGFRAVSVFGPQRNLGLRMVNTHVDLIDWRGTRGGRPDAVLQAELVAAMTGGGPVGLLTHHLVHDEQAWGFLQRLFETMADHTGCRWTGLPTLLAGPSP